MLQEFVQNFQKLFPLDRFLDVFHGAEVPALDFNCEITNKNYIGVFQQIYFYISTCDTQLIQNMKNENHNIRNTCIIVAHPDDETLWAGGTILKHPEWHWEIFSLCRASDPDRANKFRRMLSVYGANGTMSDLDDESEQRPLPDVEVRQAVLKSVERRCFNLVITHGPQGEYTRHRRHEEVSKAVCDLWLQGEIDAEALRLFAYTDGDGKFLPRPEAGAHIKKRLPGAIWQKKYRIMTDVYGFSSESWEARVTPKAEAFWCFESPSRLKEWLRKKEIT